MRNLGEGVMNEEMTGTEMVTMQEEAEEKLQENEDRGDVGKQ